MREVERREGEGEGEERGRQCREVRVGTGPGGKVMGGKATGVGYCGKAAEVPDDEESRGRGYYVGDGRGAYRKART